MPDETAKDIIKLCSIILDNSKGATEYGLGTPLRKGIEKIMQEFNKMVQCVYAYYGNGLFLGMKRGRNGKIKETKKVSNRSMEFPGTRIN